MKTLILSFFFLIASSFSGVTNQENLVEPEKPCTNCVDFANSVEFAGADWYLAYNYCLETQNPCRTLLDEVIIYS